ncbi:formyltetrahydrofolate deformylase [Vibrio sp.]|nr:formyltetrahydrofolate deformylase [Vibrio sp.]
MKQTTWILSAQCPSRLGTVDVVTRFLADNENYILDLQSFDDRPSENFCIRAEFIPSADFDASKFKDEFAKKAQEFDMEWSLVASDRKMRVAILVSKYDHCLNDLLYRYRTNQLNIEIPVIISNHPDLQELASWHNIPYHHLPITPETKPQQEAQILELIEKHDCELVVLARYMQILSPKMSQVLSGKAINIHHSLLPGFKGAKPYHQAWEKGVKLVGATAHYVNNDLDEGPIITQGVQSVTHIHSVEDFVTKGQDIESQTLAKAVRYHIEHRIFLFGNRTVILGE